MFTLTEEQTVEIKEIMENEEVEQVMVDEGRLIISLETYDDSVDEIRFFEDGAVDRRLSGEGHISNFMDIIII